MIIRKIGGRGGSLFLGTGQYFEWETLAVSSGDCRVGIVTGSLPGAGEVPADTASRLWVNIATVGKVGSLLVYDGYIWSAVDGVMQNSGLPQQVSFVNGAGWRVSCALFGSSSVQLRLTSAAWTYTPPAGFIGLDPATVWNDTGAGGILVTGSGLIATGNSAGYRYTDVTEFLAESMTTESQARYVQAIT